MPDRSLPYPGYSWSLTQHAAGFNERTIGGMLICALPFEGRANVGADITRLMIEADLFTPNERDGKNDAWRDYQQVLPELGLIVSTKLQRTLGLTSIAHAYVAGDLDFEQLANMQVLRYQYPNGHKSDISPSLRSELEKNGRPAPSSLLELQSSVGVLVKPALLILQVLIGLLDKGLEAVVTSDECRAFVVPCKRNSEWDLALADIVSSRRNGSDISQINSDQRLKRNVQDWFKLLGMTTLFETDGNSKTELSNKAFKNLRDLRHICSSESDPSHFWIPNGFSVEDRLTWFSFYGAVSPTLERLFAADVLRGDELQFRPTSDSEMDYDNPRRVGPVHLIDFKKEGLFSRPNATIESDINKLAESVKSGAIKRHAKAILHDQIVLRFAERFQKQGAKVLVDPNSVDLFVKWGPEEAAIFEVKTVTQNTLSQRLRLAVGQIKEYGFRVKKDLGADPEQALIIDRPIKKSAWQREFLNEYMNIGVICASDQIEKVYAPGHFKTSKRWSS